MANLVNAIRSSRKTFENFVQDHAPLRKNKKPPKLNSHLVIQAERTRQKSHGRRNMLFTGAIALLVIGILSFIIAALYQYGLLQGGINAFGGNVSTAMNDKIFAIMVGAGGLTTLMGLFTFFCLGEMTRQKGQLSSQLKSMKTYENDEYEDWTDDSSYEGIHPYQQTLLQDSEDSDVLTDVTDGEEDL